ncbi:MAG: ATP-binding cassette domain-containing protein [Pseudomonadota bacterium]
MSRLFLARNGAMLLDGLDMTLSPTGVSALIGPNGAGKSVLLRVLAGLIATDAGRVALPAPMRGRVGLVFQRPVLLRRNVRGNLRHTLRLARHPRRQRAERVTELLALGGLTDLADRPARLLSGGQAQRLAIVRALAADPALLLADEPTAHLDPHATYAVETLLARIAASGTKVVIVSHDQGQVARLAQEVAFLHRGRCFEVTPMPQFFQSACSPEARAYLDGTILL